MRWLRTFIWLAIENMNSDVSRWGSRLPLGLGPRTFHPVFGLGLLQSDNHVCKKEGVRLNTRHVDYQAQADAVLPPRAALMSSNPIDSFLASLDEEGLFELCLGSRIKLKNVSRQADCEPGFVPGQPHLQHKFCRTCRAGLAVGGNQLRTLTPELESVFINSTRGGFWSTWTDKTTNRNYHFRVINRALPHMPSSHSDPTFIWPHRFAMARLPPACLLILRIVSPLPSASLFRRRQRATDALGTSSCFLSRSHRPESVLA